MTSVSRSQHKWSKRGNVLLLSGQNLATKKRSFNQATISWNKLSFRRISFLFHDHSLPFDRFPWDFRFFQPSFQTPFPSQNSQLLIFFWRRADSCKRFRLESWMTCSRHRGGGSSEYHQLTYFGKDFVSPTSFNIFLVDTSLFDYNVAWHGVLVFFEEYGKDRLSKPQYTNNCRLVLCSKSLRRSLTIFMQPFQCNQLWQN